MTPTELHETLRLLSMSQASLARILGVRPYTVNRWAQGTIAVPGYVAAYLAAACEVRCLSTLLAEARAYIASVEAVTAVGLLPVLPGDAA